MKQWQEAKLQQLDIEETAHNWTGIYRDGGYIGDGEISGHLTWEKITEMVEMAVTVEPELTAYHNNSIF